MPDNFSIESNNDLYTIREVTGLTTPALDIIQNVWDAQNVGTGLGVFSGKTGHNLLFKSLKAGNNVSLVSTATGITISSSGGGGAYWPLEGSVGNILMTAEQIGLETTGFDLGASGITLNAVNNSILSSTRTSIGSDTETKIMSGGIIILESTTGINASSGGLISIQSNGGGISLEDSFGGSIQLQSTELVAVTDGDLYLESNNGLLTILGDASDIEITAHGTTLSLKGNDIRIDGDSNPSFQGAVYAEDFSANYTNRSLVDKEYVDNAVSSGEMVFIEIIDSILEIDMNNQKEKWFVVENGQDSNFEITLDNSTAMRYFTLELYITGEVVIQFPSSFLMQEDEERWDSVLKQLTLTGDSNSPFYLSVSWDGSIYHKLKASQKYV